MTPIQLWLKHRPLARKLSHGIFFPGSDQHDVIQEAEIGLWEAARRFNPDQNVKFSTFATHVITNHLKDCVKGATRGKHDVLNAAARDLSRLPHLHQVSDQCETKEQIQRLVSAINDLSEWERHCVIGVASGLSYAEIGENRRRVDNTLCSARRKLKEALP